jgi:hypothetical protein
LLAFELNSLLLAHLDYLSNNRAGNTRHLFVLPKKFDYQWLELNARHVLRPSSTPTVGS